MPLIEHGWCMHYLELTLPKIEANLALDEALLEEADTGEAPTELLRIWKADQFFVVLGRNSKVSDEVYLPTSSSESIPVFRRVSGGASVLAGPGCMFYSLLLSLKTRPHLRMLDEAHRFVMSQMVSALRPWVPRITCDGTCDLVVDGRKISGNSLRLVRNWMLYHGTFLLDFDLSAIDRWLKHPPREPAYRAGRRHSEFVTNLHVPYETVARALRSSWGAATEMREIPRHTIDRLVGEKYTQPSWNYLR